MNRALQSATYVLSDIIGSAAAWAGFFYFRKTYIEETDFVIDENFKLGIILIPFFWVACFLLAGAYKDPYRRYRTKEFGQTFLTTLIGSIVLFFILLLDDSVSSYKSYYMSFGALFSLHFVALLIPRLIITTRTVNRIHSRKIGFPTLIVGGSEKALEIYNELENQKEAQGFKFKGFLSLNGIDRELKDNLPHLGKYTDINKVISEEGIEEVIIAIETNEHDQLQRIINSIDPSDVKIKIIPDMYDILSGSVKMTSIFGAPLIRVNPEIMPQWQKTVKRALDIVFSLIALTLLLPVYIFLAIAVKLSSPGPIIFKQERIGYQGKPFNIYKFRSMRQDAEKDGPQLSSETDDRITAIGRFMRKTRLDELPQFINVLKGDMSIVGPRPERQYYINQIMEKAPHYRHLHKVKPGITSWGQVKFGYAENVDEMVQRLKYDILYLENMSLSVDFKIMIYTVRIVLKGSGK